MKMEKEHNLLTKRLLAEGYTADKHPTNVEVGRPMRMDASDPLDNYDGGFVYKRWWIHRKTFKTPCGLQCEGSSCMSGLYYMGMEWSYENDLALIHCPYDKADCLLKHPYMREAPVNKYHCDVHLTEEEYQYEGSVEELKKLRDDEIEKEAAEFSVRRKGRTCRHHMRYDREAKAWSMRYDPNVCATMGCAGECPILGRKLDRKRGNVFYDIKMTYRRYDLDGTLFEGQIDTYVEKGARFLERPASMDICRNIVKLCGEEIERRVKLNRFHQELFFAEYHGRQFSVEILNIRAEEKESRDLLQDLRDIKGGATIVHVSDAQKHQKEEKKKKRREAQEKKIRKLEKKLLEVGYHNLEEHSLDRVHADKWLGPERIEELEEKRKKLEREKENQPMQLSMF